MAEEWTKGKVKDLVGKALIKGEVKGLGDIEEDQKVINRKLAEVVRLKKKEIENYKRKRGEKKPDKNSLVGVAREKKEDKKEKEKNEWQGPDKNYTKIPNRFIEAMYTHCFGPNQRRVLLYLVRMTWGWRKGCGFVRVTQCAKELRIPKQRVSEALSSLEKRGIVTVNRDRSYTIQTDVNLWQGRPKKKKA